MNTVRIKSACAQIERDEIALRWLNQYGQKLTGRDGDASVRVSVHFAGSCTGAREAEEVLSAFARLRLPEIVQDAIRNCENTIRISADAIREELAGSPTQSQPTPEGREERS